MFELSQETIRTVNLVMLIFCSVEAVIVLLHSPPIHQRTKTSRLFSTEMVVIVIAVLCYTLGLLLDLGHEGIFSVILQAIAYVGVYVILFFHVLYVKGNINLVELEDPIADGMNRLALLVCIVGSALWLLVIFNPASTRLEEPIGVNNLDFWVGYAGGIVLIGMIVYLLIKYRSRLGNRRVAALLTLPVLLAIATILESTVLHGLELRYPAIAIGLVVIYTYHHMEIEYRYKKEEAENMRNRMTMATGRMNPHYLYNVLASIYYLCETDPKQAQHAIGLFSDYLRNTLETLEKVELVNFKWELEVIKNYLTLEEIRFGDRIKVNYDIEYDEFTVPPLSIQPLVENAVKHGLLPKEEGGTVTVTTRRLPDGSAQIVIKDDGKGFNVAQLKAQDEVNSGIAVVRERLRTEIGGELSVTSFPEKGTTSTVTIKPDSYNRELIL